MANPDLSSHHGSSSQSASADGGRQRESKTIATGLKTLYRNVVEEPIPDDLMDLLDSLDDE